MKDSQSGSWRRVLQEVCISRQGVIALAALCGIIAYLGIWYFALVAAPWTSLPLWGVLLFGGAPLIKDLLEKARRGAFGSDLLAGISICTSILLAEPLAGAFVVLMLSGGEALERFAIRRASSVLEALARRMPQRAHVKRGEEIVDVAVAEIAVGELVSVFPHEISPVDGLVVEGHGIMDESFLTGEPYMISKAPGAEVISGAVNGERALTIRATRKSVDSRYAKISRVMEETARSRVRLRRLGETLGAWYTPIALLVAALAWGISGEAERFLSVLVVATPCPLLIAIPVAVIGAISLAAKRGIIVRDPAILEQLDTCRTIILDKTGTLTYGVPQVVEVVLLSTLATPEIGKLLGAVEQYSKHPLAIAAMAWVRAQGVPIVPADGISEPPGGGLRGEVGGRSVRITHRRALEQEATSLAARLPPTQGGLECVVLVDGSLAALVRFRDEPRPESSQFVAHLGPKHRINRALIVSGDRESEVRALAARVGIAEIHAGKTPEEKVAIVRVETERACTLYLGDGINDAPALSAATVGIALGNLNEITTEAADAVIMEPSLVKVDELFHIARRMRRVAIESALGGMLLSMIGMGFAAAGLLSPVAGAISQEVIDLCAVLNALRAAVQPRTLEDWRSS